MCCHGSCLVFHGNRLCGSYSCAGVLCKNGDCGQGFRARALARTQCLVLLVPCSFRWVSPPKGYLLRKWGRAVQVFLVGCYPKSQSQQQERTAQMCLDFILLLHSFGMEASVWLLWTLCLFIHSNFFTSLNFQEISDNLLGVEASLKKKSQHWVLISHMIPVSWNYVLSFRWCVQSSLPQSLPIPHCLIQSQICLIFPGPCLYLRTIDLSGRGFNASRQLSTEIILSATVYQLDFLYGMG